MEGENLLEFFSERGQGIVKTYASDESQCVQPQPFHCAVTQCIVNDTTFLSLAVRRCGFHDKEGPDRDIHRLDDDHIRERDELRTYQTVDPGNDGR